MHPELSDALSFEARLVLDSFLAGHLSAGRLYERLAACGAQAPAVEDSRTAGRRCAFPWQGSVDIPACGACFAPSWPLSSSDSRVPGLLPHYYNARAPSSGASALAAVRREDGGRQRRRILARLCLRDEA
jgi:hypothetical protein